MRYLYLDCSTGIHEEALVSSLIVIGASVDFVTRAVMSLPIPGLKFSVTKEEQKREMSCVFRMEWQLEKTEYRKAELKTWITKAELSGKSKKVAEEILEKYEAAWKPSRDSGIDMQKEIRMTIFAIALAACLEDLGIWDVIIPWIGEGSGFISDENGWGTIPAPEVMKILEGTDLNLRTLVVNRELITPEGISMAAGIQTSARLPDLYRIIKFGRGYMGEGNMTTVGATLIEDGNTEQGIVYRLETNMDDVTGEALGYVMDRLMKAGAGDVHYHSVYMKKNRPAYQLNVICHEQLIPVMEQIIFQETTTLGIRRVPMFASRLKRTSVTLETSLGTVRAKCCQSPKEDGIMGKRIYPEYASVVEICSRYQKSFQEVNQILMTELQDLI